MGPLEVWVIETEQGDTLAVLPITTPASAIVEAIPDAHRLYRRPVHGAERAALARLFHRQDR